MAVKWQAGKVMDLTSAPRRRRRIGFTVAAVIGALVLAVLSFQLGASTSGAAVPAAAEPQVADELEPLGALFDELREEAVDPPDADALVEGAAEGMLESLDDPYAHFYDEESYADLNQALDGQFSGVGLVLEDREDGPVIVNVIEGAPADEAGISVGERIVEVDGRDVSDATIEELVAVVKGEAGTTVELTLMGGDRGRYTVTVTRADIDLPQIESRMLDDGAGYIRLYQFTEDVGDDVRGAADALIEDGAEGLVLDLRGNPGGLLQEAVAVSSVFIEEGPIVSVEQRAGGRETFEATGEAIDVPLVVLVDEGSASASEIVAGAVKDRDRGQLVGETTFGKGTVQTIANLPDGFGVKFTTAKYYTPSGESIEDDGITPDRVVRDSDEQLAAAQDALSDRLAQAE